MEIIYALAGHIRTTSPISYHEIIGWPTEYIRALVEWYERPEEPETVYILPYKFFENGGKIKVGFRKTADGRYEQVLKTA